MSPQLLGRQWEEVLHILDQLLYVLKANHVPHFLMQMLFKQIFAFINVQLFNQLLLRRECCSFSNGEYVKTGLAEVEHWIDNASRKYVGDSWDELKFIRQVGCGTEGSIPVLGACLFFFFFWFVCGLF